MKSFEDRYTLIDFLAVYENAIKENLIERYL